MSLERYREKRHFQRTPEPAGRPPRAGADPRGGGRFVVQRHRATRLHYDVRLEIGGVLMSWAVPKGPTLDPGVRRMAVHVEDHPLEYFDFEGTIPRGEYGAGDVIVWDWGRFEPEGTTDPGAAVRRGELKFRLIGEKLAGSWVLVRTRRAGAGGGRDDREDWLLIKHRDDAAVEGWDPEAYPRSVKTGRTNDEVKADAPAVWRSDAPADEARIDLARAEPGPMPDWIEPMKATLADRPFDDPDWLFEVKWDGYRVEAVVRDGRLRLWTRNRQDAATYFPELAAAPRWIAANEAIVDGEVVALDGEGRPRFTLLQERLGGKARGSAGRRHDGGTGTPGGGGAAGGAAGAAEASSREDGRAGSLAYQVFDLLYLDGRSLLAVPLEERKRLLQLVLREDPIVTYAGHVVGDGVAFFEAAGERGLEGMVAKLRASRYEPGRRSEAWLKIKHWAEQEVVVGGWTSRKESSTDLGSLVVGVYEDGRLRHAGGVGSGLDARTRADLLARLRPLETAEGSFEPAPRLPGVRWVAPTLVVRVSFSEWTRDGHLRQPVYRGLEPDRDARLVVRETAVGAATARRTAERTAERERPAEPDGRPTPGGGAGRPAPPPETASTGRAGATADELRALDGLGAGGSWQIGGRTLQLTNLDKVLFPDGDLTKRDLVRYFVSIAPVLLPHLVDRPLNLHRYPNGAGHPGFWQKDIPASAPAWLRRWTETGVADREANTHLVADSVASLAWLANQAAFEFHAWTARLEAPDRPTFALIDIDPGERTTWDETLVLARLFRTALGHLGVRGSPKVTGRHGIQVWIPIVPHYTYAETSAWVESLSRAVGAIEPSLVSWEWERARRGGLARLDYTQNAPNKTLVAAYAVRPGPAAPVSAPIDWAELDDPALRPDRWTILSILPRVAERGDLFAGVLRDPQELPSLE